MNIDANKIEATYSCTILQGQSRGETLSLSKRFDSLQAFFDFTELEDTKIWLDDGFCSVSCYNHNFKLVNIDA